jgi:hypothetical protein
VNELAGLRPTPVANMNTNPFAGAHADATAKIGNLNAQRPTPVASMNKSNFDSSFGTIVQLIAQLNRMSINLNAYASTGAAESALNYTARTRYSQVIQTVVTPRSTGGPVDSVVRAATGRVVGPGTNRSDSVRAVGPDGTDWRLSNGEWVIQEPAVRALERRYGLAAMPTINSGQLPVATDTGSSGPLVKTQGGVVPQTVIQGGVTLSFPNVTTIADPDLPRQLLEAIEQGLVKLRRERG